MMNFSQIYFGLSPRFLLVTTSLLGLIVLKIALVIASGPMPLVMDAGQYWLLGHEVLQGDWLLRDVPIAYRTPGYPWLIAVLQQAFDDRALQALVVTQGLFYFGSVVLAGVLAMQVTGHVNAIPIVVVILLPGISAVTYTTAVLTETLFTLLLMTHWVILLSYVNRPTAFRSIGVALTFAALLLTRPVVMYWWVPMLVMLCWHSRAHGMQASTGAGVGQATGKSPWRPVGRFLVSHGALMAFVASVLLLPWLKRNEQMFGNMFVTEFVGRNVWIVTFQDESGAGLPLPQSDSGDAIRERLDLDEDANHWRDTWVVSNHLVRSGLDDAQADRLMKQTAIDAMSASPWPFLYKLVRRSVNFWRCIASELPRHEPQSTDYAGQKVWSIGQGVGDRWISLRASQFLWINTAILVVVCIAAAYSLLRVSSRPIAFGLISCLAYIGFVTAAIEIPAYRYRMVLEPLIASVLAIALIHAYEDWHARLSRSHSGLTRKQTPRIDHE